MKKSDCEMEQSHAAGRMEATVKRIKPQIARQEIERRYQDAYRQADGRTPVEKVKDWAKDTLCRLNLVPDSVAQEWAFQQEKEHYILEKLNSQMLREERAAQGTLHAGHPPMTEKEIGNDKIKDFLKGTAIATGLVRGSLQNRWAEQDRTLRNKNMMEPQPGKIEAKVEDDLGRLDANVISQRRETRRDRSRSRGRSKDRDFEMEM